LLRVLLWKDAAITPVYSPPRLLRRPSGKDSSQRRKGMSLRVLFSPVIASAAKQSLVCPILLDCFGTLCLATTKANVIASPSPFGEGCGNLGGGALLEINDSAPITKKEVRDEPAPLNLASAIAYYLYYVTSQSAVSGTRSGVQLATISPAQAAT